MSKYVSYEQAGVNIDANDEMVERIQSSLASTFGPRVIALPGGFAGLFRLDYDEKLFKKNYKNPVLVACTDGVGSKVQLAAKARKFDTVGIDLVAMSVNDMLVIGAEPLFFLDYVALHKLEPALVAELVKGIAAGCRMADCALIGGETAEMPDTYRKGDFDLAGFAVGVVERDKTITGKKVRPGDVILGLRSSGLHSNGYTLARNICFKQARLKMNDVLDELDGTTVGETLLTPTRIYVQPIVKLLTKYKVKRVVHAMAHITGGGLVGNIPRILPKDCNAVLKKSSWPRPKIFPFLQKAGPVEEDEMFRVFNMGIGYVLIVAADFADSIGRNLQRWGEKVNRIGTVTAGSGKVVLKN
ncbi:phosphoribosylformylglycinamidine cyclo-ligase [Anaerobaca lacustris]|uniref:Phosphoribosylformylglycinamidine cyclo-ligase n=1 Tax=Anaerobaca lacustris TaxID=3044600 RepID=A0AAW6TT28_9BACT|nr:phosphoribosylformylglycinamidine cyclo-ligase [Sedimentisphaerales bacterium M17dextr]